MSRFPRKVVSATYTAPTTTSAVGVYNLVELTQSEQSNTWPIEADFSISPAVGGVTFWKFSVNGALDLSTAGTWTITMLNTVSVTVKVWGAGGTTAGYNAGAGGAATGTISLASGSSYIIRVGSPTGGGSRNGTAGQGGGYSGLFITSETHANAKIIGGGGGGGGRDDGGRGAVGGAGGGTTGSSSSGFSSCIAGGGSQSAGGGGGGGTYGGGSGSALTGGNGSGTPGSGYAGGGGGSGYYGGGGGGLQASWAGAGGGGGSGYIGGVTSATNYAGSGTTPGNSGDGNRGSSGNVDTAGRVYITT